MDSNSRRAYWREVIDRQLASGTSIVEFGRDGSGPLFTELSF
ncbi:MAG: hypothetical protein ACI9HK_004120 [Pirellulaceae bacterium]|jgi:hypothetical protein